MDIPWEDVQLLLAVAEATSLSGAAKRLRVAQPTVSRRLAELEGRLGEPLFTRHVDGVRATPFAERLLTPGRRMAEWAAEVDRAAERAETAPRGVVRITAPPGVAFDLVAPFAAFVRERLPEVSLEVVSTVQYLDLARREADLALRFSKPPSRDLVTLAAIDTAVAAFASPAYAKTLHPGFGVADVAWIAWAPPMEHLAPNAQLAARIPDFRPAFASDDYLVQLAALHAGVGAMFLGRMRHRFSGEAKVVELGLEFGRLTTTLYLVASRSALDIPRVRAVSDLLVRELERAKDPPKKQKR